MTQSQHIVIVDDEAPAREMVGDYLKMHGFAVTLCDGGKSLRGAIQNGTPDLVVLDLNMPEEDGLSIIRDLKTRINVPVIMLTATASPIDRVVGLLKVFAANPKRVLSRERLLELANARDSEAFDRAVDLRIMRIRRKIELDPTKPAVIRTIRGGGYLFSPVGEKA